MFNIINTKDFKSNYMLIIYAQSLETLTMALHYFLLGLDSEILFMLQEIFYMLLIIFIFYFFSDELSKMVGTQNTHKIISIPLLVIYVLYVISLSTAVIVLRVKDQKVFECKDWIWMFSATSGLFLSGVLGIFAVYMQKKMEKMPLYTKWHVDQKRSRQLWLEINRVFILVFTLSYIIMIIDSGIKMINDQTCVDYTQSTIANIFLFIIIRWVTHYASISYSLFVFWPRKSTKIDVILP